MADDKIIKVERAEPWPEPPPARRATDRQAAPTGEGTVVLGEVLNIVADLVRIREAGLTCRDAEQQKQLRKVADDLEARAEMGRAKYGTYLRANNGRSAALDLYQEVLDGIMYSAQAGMEGDRAAGGYLHLLIDIARQLAGHLEELNGKCDPGNRHEGNR